MARRQTLRVLVGLLASLTAAAPLLSTAHLITVRHATCDHGETIEIEEIGGETHRHAAPCIRESDAPREHGHAHCSLAAHRHTRSADHPRAIQLPLVAAIPARTPSLPFHRLQIGILLIAPKSSPPA